MPFFLIDGALCAAFHPPIIRDGRVFAATVGCLARSFDRIRIDADDTVSLMRDGHRVMLAPRTGLELVDGAPRRLTVMPFWSLGALYIPLRASVEPFGGSVVSRSNVVTVRFPRENQAVRPATPAPAWYPRAPRNVIFTPMPSPMPIFTAPPGPRRMPVPVRVVVPAHALGK